MYKIAILGCENSHANTFLNYIVRDKLYTDVEVVGVYSTDTEAAQKLHAEYNVPVLQNFDDLKDKVDGVIVTARHGDEHYKFLKPYIKENLPVFMDKPITIKESDVEALVADCKKHNVRMTGGSCCKYASFIKELKKDALSQKVYGGAVRTPVSLKNAYGDFYFYSQHLVETVLTIFGHFPKSVSASLNKEILTAVFHYDGFDVTGSFIDNNYTYYASLYLEKEVKGQVFDVDNSCFLSEFDAFYQLLKGADQVYTYEEIASPVYVLNAIMRALESKTTENIKG